MGNIGKKAKAKVDVNLESTILLQGDVINGKINITPNEGSDITKLQNPKINFSLIQEQDWQSFIFSGEEKTSKDGDSTNTFLSNQTLNCSEYKDKNFSEGITIPFQYKIPDNINPSFEWPHTVYEFAYIRNFLTVNIPELSYKTKILLIILKKPCPLSSPLRISKEEERKKFILFGSGSIFVEGSYPKSSFPILGNIPLTVRVDASKSDVLIKDVTVKLKRKLQFYSKGRLNSMRTILQDMYEEKKKVCSKCEDLLFNIPFKDSNEIEYNLKSSALGENTEICCLLPNVNTNIMNVIYYIKIIADPDDLLAKKIELKMMVDFHSKDDDNLNTTVFNNFNNQINKINSGQVDLNYLDPYLNHQNNNFDKRMSQCPYTYHHSKTLQSEFNVPPNYQNQNYEQNNYNSYNENPFVSNYNSPPPPQNYNGYQDNNNLPNYQNMNENNINNKYPNYEDNFTNNNSNNGPNQQNTAQFSEPPKENLNEEVDLPTLDEIEEQSNINEQKEKKYTNEYPDL